MTKRQYQQILKRHSSTLIDKGLFTALWFSGFPVTRGNPNYLAIYFFWYNPETDMFMELWSCCDNKRVEFWLKNNCTQNSLMEYTRQGVSYNASNSL